jgi:hypothetical protein
MPRQPLPSPPIYEKIADVNTNIRGKHPCNRVIPVTSDNPLFSDQDMNKYGTYLVQHLTPEYEPHLETRTFDMPLNRICGSWITLLPEIANSSKHPMKILIPMVKATAMALSGISHTPSTTTTSLYTSALQKFREALEPQQQVPHNELLVAGMCLALVEVTICYLFHTWWRC